MLPCRIITPMKGLGFEGISARLFVAGLVGVFGYCCVAKMMSLKIQIGRLLFILVLNVMLASSSWHDAFSICLL